MKTLTELARFSCVLDSVCEAAARAVGLTKRSAVALEMLSDEPSLSNLDLQTRFVQHHISTELSAKKDASSAKGQLLAKELIASAQKVSIFKITDEGRKTVERMHEVKEAEIGKLVLTEGEREYFNENLVPHRRAPMSSSTTSSRPSRAAHSKAH